MTLSAKFVQQPTQYDILCGKDKHCLRHEGSRRFKLLVESYQLQYQQCETKQDKMNLTKVIFDSIRSTSARFLKFNSQFSCWEEISQISARDKISHALRRPPQQLKQSQSTNQKKRKGGTAAAGLMGLTNIMMLEKNLENRGQQQKTNDEGSSDESSTQQSVVSSFAFPSWSSVSPQQSRDMKSKTISNSHHLSLEQQQQQLSSLLKSSLRVPYNRGNHHHSNSLSASIGNTNHLAGASAGSNIDDKYNSKPPPKGKSDKTSLAANDDAFSRLLMDLQRGQEEQMRLLGPSPLVASRMRTSSRSMKNEEQQKQPSSSYTKTVNGHLQNDAGSGEDDAFARLLDSWITLIHEHDGDEAGNIKLAALPSRK